MEIDEQPNGKIQQPEVRQELGLIHGMQRLFALQFHGDQAVNNQVGAESAIEFYRFVHQRHGLLPLHLQPGHFEFVLHACLVCRLQKARAEFSMDFHRRADDFGSDVIRVQFSALHMTLTAYPTANVTHVPIVTHHVNGTCDRRQR